MCSANNITGSSIYMMFIYLVQYKHPVIFLSAFRIQVLLNRQYAVFKFTLCICSNAAAGFAARRFYYTSRTGTATKDFPLTD